jgi:transcriptional regulator with XRE-family HTH domain
MRFAEAQARSGLTDRELAERAGSSTRTVWRIKQEHLPTRESVMRRLAEALGVEVDDIDEFREAKRERVHKAAVRKGLPPEHLAELEVEEEVYEIQFPDERFIRQSALTYLRRLMTYLVSSGPPEDVDRIYREVRRKATAREEANRRQDTEQ